MAVDFLGGAPRAKKQKGPEVKYHIPEEEKKVSAKQPRPAPAEMKPTQPSRVNLTGGFYAAMRRRKLLITAIFAILVMAAAGLWYAFYMPLPAPAPTVPQPVAQVPQVQEPQVTSPPVAAPPAPLPDTELAPLRGALVRFPLSSTIYLVENNGELRKVITQTVIFENGQSIAQIDRRLIYLINARWEGTRRGEEDVSGQVDFDPRVLTQSELQPFL